MYVVSSIHPVTKHVTGYVLNSFSLHMFALRGTRTTCQLLLGREHDADQMLGCIDMDGYWDYSKV